MYIFDNYLLPSFYFYKFKRELYLNLRQKLYRFKFKLRYEEIEMNCVVENVLTNKPASNALIKSN